MNIVCHCGAALPARRGRRGPRRQWCDSCRRERKRINTLRSMATCGCGRAKHLKAATCQACYDSNRRRHARSCAICAAEFQPMFHNQRTCGKRECLAVARNPGKRHTPFVCEHCGAVFKRKRGGDGRDAKRFCSKSCAGKHRSAVAAHQRALRKETERLSRLKPCAECGTPFIGRANAACCSAECQRVRQNRKKASESLATRQSKRPLTATCKECGTVFARRRIKSDQNRYCSRRCQRRMKARVDARYQKKRGGIGTHAQRAKFYGVECDRGIMARQVFDRAGWRCQICQEPTPLELSGSREDRAPEIDHVIPMAAGGGHVWPNVQCACRKCNNEKGVRVPTVAERALWASRIVKTPLTPENSLVCWGFPNGPVSVSGVCISRGEIPVHIR